ncbi:MAG: BamA/TamA family outer membrane protein [candidate division Zixibacteria bacterium]|nr:BamA/TamA family outer membrane protein [candidate division Zixibacteria bacterium]
MIRALSFCTIEPELFDEYQSGGIVLGLRMSFHTSGNIIGIAIISVIFLLAISSVSYCQENFTVRGLEFEGNQALSDNQLEAYMSTYATGSFQQTIFRKKPFLFSNDILQSDLSRLLRYYQREGFLYAQIEAADLEKNRQDRTVRIKIQITENDSISITGVQCLPFESHFIQILLMNSLFDNLRPSLEIRVGKRFRDDGIEADRLVLAEAFENAGYPYVEINPEIAIDEESKIVNIDWIVNPGPRCVFGIINISGNQHVADSFIRRSLNFSSGIEYSRLALDESQKRIFGLGVFHIVTVSAQLSAEQDSIIPVEIRIKEAPRFTTKIGLGYGREEKIRAYSDSRILGVLGGARHLNLYAKHSSIEPYRLSLKVIQPAFISNYTSLELNPFVLRQKEPAFTENRYGNNVSILHRFKDYLYGSVTHTFERIDLDTNSLADMSIIDELNDLYNKSSIQLGLIGDYSSPVFSPRRGNYAAGIFKISGLGLGSDYHFSRLLLDMRRYQSLFGTVFAGRLKIGGIKSNDSHKFIPVEDRFYAGGSASVRGWARSELGPISDEIPIGGKSLFEASLEWRFPIISIVSGAVFYDFGNVWLDSYSYSPEDLRYSGGMGLRVRTPIGPIRLDLARPINDEENTMQVHLSVGEAF